MLGVFKYTNWLLGSLNGLCQVFTGQDPFPLYDIILPLGISFYTFQTLSYTIDVYRGEIEAPTDLLTFSLFVSFFPQLVAGPIVRAAHLVPQLERGPRYDERRVLEGLALVAFGLFKKVVIADNLARIASLVYATPAAFGGLDTLLGTYAFAFQIYCDFSGYSDIARGLGNLLGFDLGENFRRPYFSVGIRDFWRRWHISLSTWLRDYLYIPLGGSRGRDGFVIRNVMVTMLLGGLWHGASWTFVVWGGIQGIWITIERLLTSRRRDRPPGFAGSPMGRALLSLATFHGVCVTWVFFRSQTFSDAVDVLTGFARGASAVPLPLGWLGLIPLMLAVDALATRESVREWLLRRPVAFWTTLWTAAAVIVLFGVSGANEFIYFQF